MDVVGIGSLNVDLIFEIDELDIDELQLEPGGETFGTTDRFSKLLDLLNERGRLVGQSGGGSAANTMCAMGRMGFEAGMLGMVGDDHYADFLLNSLEKVDSTRIRRSNGTGMCVSIISGDDRSLVVLPNANDRFITAPCDLEYLRKSRLVHLTSFVGDKSMRAQTRIARDLEPGTMVSLDPGEIYARKGLNALRPLIERADIMFPSEREVRLLTDQEPQRGARKLLRMGPQIVVCTLGSKGALIVTSDQTIEIKAVGTEVVDKTGAGDVFAAGMLAGILKGWDLQRCGEFAAIAAARSISSYGREGYPDQELLSDFESEG